MYFSDGRNQRSLGHRVDQYMYTIDETKVKTKHAVQIRVLAWEVRCSVATPYDRNRHMMHTGHLGWGNGKSRG